MARTEQDARRNQTVKLKDGRTLGYAEYGDPSGTPLIFFHGTPGSRLMAVPEWDDTSLGIRLIAPDRPGIGLSDYNPKRTILNWSDDVRELADELSLDRFVVAGVSGGGPHSLACAYALPDRVLRAGVISGAAPMDAQTIKQMHTANRITFTLAQRAPFVLRPLFGLMGWIAKKKPDANFGEKQLPPADREILHDAVLKAALLQDAPESYRQGARAIADEAILFANPWGFELEDIRVPVFLWHGGQDLNAPLQMAKDMEHRIPDCTATYFPDEGHLYFLRRWPEIGRALKV